MMDPRPGTTAEFSALPPGCCVESGNGATGNRTGAGLRRKSAALVGSTSDVANNAMMALGNGVRSPVPTRAVGDWVTGGQ